MRRKHVGIIMILATLGFAFTTLILDFPIPKTWDVNEIHRFHLSPPDSSVKVRYASEEYYNSLPEHIIYKTYPVYVREFEKPGYLDSLRSLEPEIAFDPAKIKTQEDWIKAGKEVFHWPVASYREIKDKSSHLQRASFEARGKYAGDGVYPATRYMIPEKGKVVQGSLSCAACHTRIMDNGKMIDGAQGNVFNLTGFATDIESGRIPFPALFQSVDQLTRVPWTNLGVSMQSLTKEEIVRYLKDLPEGVSDRQGMAYLHPLTIPSLIGIKDIKYLDHTGVMKHENPGDFMRYAAFNQGLDMATAYNDFIPMGVNNNSELPARAQWSHPFGYMARRYSDAQLYALTQYIYSLKPPENPAKSSKAILKDGAAVFQKAGCVTCHTPPLFTNNKLTPVNGFEPPADHFTRYDIFNISVETDSVAALYSRRATGYYKIPSLRGLWYRSAFFHGGNLTKLEEVFDKKRLRPDFVPSGYMPPNVKSMAVKGHPFGLELSTKEKAALIAYLKSL